MSCNAKCKINTDRTRCDCFFEILNKNAECRTHDFAIVRTILFTSPVFKRIESELSYDHL